MISAAKYSVSLVVLFSIVVLAGCGGGGSKSGSTNPPPPTPTLSSIAVTGTAANVAVGATLQLKATGTYSDSTTKDLTSSVTWSSSDTTIATVSASGLVTGVKAGPVSIKATSGSVNGSMAVTIDAAPLTSIAVTGSSSSLLLGATLQLKATGTYSDSTTQDLTATVTWSSADTTVATVSNGGLVTGVKAGPVTITAASGAVNGTMALTVNAASITSITITQPSSATVPLGGTLQLAATGTFNNNTSGDVTNMVTWASSDATVIAVDANTGLAIAKAGTGTADITASSGSVTSAKLTLTAAAAAPKALMIVPSSINLAVLQWIEPAAYLVYTDDSVQDVSRSASFTVANSAVASLSSPFLGFLTGEAPGATTITASYNGLSAQANVNVSGSLSGLTVVPKTASVHPGGELWLQATGTFDSGASVTPLIAAFWSSDNQNVATLTQGMGGLVTGKTAGAATITARSAVGTLKDTSSVTVDDLAFQSFAVTPNTLNMAINVTEQLTATGTFSNGTNTDTQVLKNVAWSSSNEAVVTVDSAGLVRSLTPGTAVITATLPGGQQQTVTVNAAHQTFDHFDIAQSNPTPKVGEDDQFTAKVFTKEGNNYDITTTAIWFSSDPSIALIDAWGKMHALKAGTVTIRILFHETTTTTVTIQ